MRRTDKPAIYDRQSADLPINSIVAEAVVDDPLEPGAKLRVVRQLRDDPLGRLQAGDKLRSEEEKRADKRLGRDTGLARFEAAKLWLAFYERAEIGNVRSLDIGKPPGGGMLPDMLTTTRRKAMAKIAEADRALGADGCVIIRDFLVGRLTMAQIALSRGMGVRAGKEYVGRRLRECFERLARLWNFA